jgi:hypothetical protein
MRFTPLLLLAPLAACDAPLATDQQSASSTPGGPCHPTFNVSDNDASCYSGPTASDTLALLRTPSFSSTFVPGGLPPGYPDSNSLAASALTVTQTYSGGPIACTELPTATPSCDPGPGGQSGATSCTTPRCDGYGIVSLPLNVTFTTADGAFNENFQAIGGYDNLSAFEWGASFPASQLKGTYHPVFGSSETIEFYGMVIEGSDGGETSIGTVTEHIENGTNGGESGGGGDWGYPARTEVREE